MKLLKVLSASAVAAAVASTLVVAAGPKRQVLVSRQLTGCSETTLSRARFMFATQTPKKVAARL